ncbi:MAG: bifunctional adenosylcobinamide kinase/adenosylcobinamide-phosphate guanylyltransferase [Candidatus Nitrospinota bacterium M3_3B_026]
MGGIILVTGGARSGKSAHALRIAERTPPPRAYVATCPPLDDEMEKRIEAHRRAREGLGYKTIEEWLDIPGALARAEGASAAVVDCLTLWVGNMMMNAEKEDAVFTEEEAARAAGEAARACRAAGFPVILVTNEVGMGVIPASEQARRFVDAAGRVNQVMAAAADEVWLVASGIPMRLK